MKEPTQAARITAVKTLRKIGQLFSMRGDMFAADAFGRAIGILSTGIGEGKTHVKSLTPLPNERQAQTAIDVVEYEARRRLGNYFLIADTSTLREVKDYLTTYKRTGKLPPM